MSKVISPELAAVRSQADALGIQYHHRANVLTIGQLIKSAESLQESGLLPAAPTKNVNSPGPKMGPGKVMSEKEYRAEQTANRIRTAGALKRIRVTCMNPLKRSWKGETLSVGSRKMGTFKKFVPFDGMPYHVPQVIYDMLKERKCTVFITEKVGKEEFKKGKLIPEFAIEDLPPLTQKEMHDLAQRQALASTGL